ncbi:hypothetical protein LRK24_05200 [Rhodanobacter denitrificans]|uniref:Uncharacterized protein n=1 Tax=Rhodanobacter denitrificans TaxID=666685 RepID=M4NKQ8_9GAMM|nr:hypothetical protein [Rhodanobacter denitrificans]AGG90273.1 hypothetical protein R2APBS1_3203 [Rhodanobacter denitrificans]UJM85658.1 hypothetical protein LRJ86_12825 [Rhodanobacter denitrificans]UJM91314.1 hypothetical protein LRK24_05200 [Rhodanobacter denitrificans]
MDQDFSKLQFKKRDPEKTLAGFDYVWACWPLSVAFVGGALGGLCGGAAAAINVKLFKSGKSKTYKYVASLLVSLGALVAYFILAMLFVAIFHTAKSS